MDGIGMDSPIILDPNRGSRWALWGCLAAAVVGLALLTHSAFASSATYDEVAYMRVAARWYRTGDQAAITRMGSPLTFWKLQQLPTLWLLDQIGRSDWVDDPIAHQAELLPIVRCGAFWIWLAALALVACWAQSLYGNGAMVFAAWLFALSPNLLAHGALVTMEMPVTAAFAACFWMFSKYIRRGSRAWLLGSAVTAGLAFSCKFTAILLPGLVAIAWAVNRPQRIRPTAMITSIVVFVCIMISTDLVITGFALLPSSERVGAHPSLGAGAAGGVLSRLVELPIPQDWVGLFTQVRHQRSGGPSYLLGERRMFGWWYYYWVAMAVKIPMGTMLLLIARTWQAWISRKSPSAVAERMLWLVPLAFVVAASLGSTRNYGIRYLLPVAPLCVVWISGLVTGGRWAHWLAGCGLVMVAIATLAAHPHELTFFNRMARGTYGGRHVLSDSNLDWGQGARGLVRLQARRPELCDLTLYYFGATDPRHYGVAGEVHVIDAGELHPGLPVGLQCTTAYLGVSVSLAWGPWGPPHYFDALKTSEPVAWTDDGTIAVYRAADLNIGGPPAARRELFESTHE